ncbi:homocitrate synthase [Thermoanaerobacterium saccharolyticum]|jgi:homocitrate synthase NifV|uniref:Homocitrate synthase n=2 Tax=Thermoanaerobacterium TaxID=28895 RepID=W9E7K3_9THEO|nr:MULTISPECIES: homocitrate synthase [Thermoanaerobacterium]AFK85067.1 homocitrate synthase [Thermoanaerobacterium saccharolyticum JW/SL-YS485]ETO37493.1 homocitrate synthase [Thermoanaerobacterium aotearoense SCUT27]ORX24569.1 homocitrate synthase [Thermoanaerobacterium sp. PSU-2]
MKFKKEDGKLYLVDTTLRDGEQTAGVVFANSEKIRIAKMLDEIGVHQLEVGIPTMGGDEKETIAKIAKLGLNASIMAWNRAVVNDVKESLECGVDAVAISISTSDIHIEHKLRTSRQWVLDHMTSAVEFAKKDGVYVSVNAEDASRTDMDFLIEFARCAKQAGADRLRFCDTVGILDPFKTYDIIKKIKEAIDIDIEMHTHNDFGMATANALAGFKAGANFIGVTVNGLGERAGNAALEEVVMALKHVYKYDINIDTKRFREISEYVSTASGRQLPSWKAIVGTNVFAHESGIHVDGALKDPHTYEIFDPDEVGLERQIVIGKHSGTAALINKFKEYGRVLPEEEAKELLPYVRSLSIQLKRPLFDKELIYLYEEHISKIKAI